VKTGIFGGTFDPPHIGHLIVAQDAALALGLDRILFVPAAQPPHKLAMALSAPAVRARMLRLAIAGDACFAADLLELDRAGPSYTADTLRELAAREPATEWTLLMGVDQYAEFGSWREPGSIRATAAIAVLTRSGDGGGGSAPGAPGGQIAAVPRVRPLADGDVEVAVTRVDVSSTLIRARIAAGVSIRHMVPAAVAEFIAAEGLYRRNGAVAAG
jgi:nicotinate-nucleotide adenylyltransferase